MTLQVINEFGLVFFSIVVGFMGFKKLNSFHRMLFVQVISYAIVYILSHIITLYQEFTNQTLNNHWLFNLGTFIEITILLLAGYRYFKDKMRRSLVVINYIFYLVVYMGLVGLNGILEFSVYAYATGSLVVTIVYSVILQDCFSNTSVPILRSPTIWMSTGVLIYFACNLPYFSLFNYLNHYYLDLSKFFYTIITQILANLRYLFLIVGFWLIRKQSLVAIDPKP